MLKITKRAALGICFAATLISGCGLQQASEMRPKTEHNQKSVVEKWQAMRFGMFIHFGAYADLAGVWQGKRIEKLGEQIQRHADISQVDYEQVVKRFNPNKFDADAIVKLAKQTGMKYIVLTVKHHDGFAMFDSKHTDFDIVDFTPYKKDLLKQLADATKRQGLKLGVYYSTPDWHFNGPHPERNPRDGKISVFGKVSKANEDYQVAQLEELMNNYGEIVEVFFDMGEPTLEQSRRFREVVKKYQPDALINGRVMNEQGDFLTMPDNHVPDTPILEFPWETPGTFYHTWGYKSWVKGLPVEQQVGVQIRKLSDIASMGGNFLLNIGPKGDGSVLPYEREVLTGIGHWLDKHKQAVFGTGINPFLKLDWGQVTTTEQALYLHVHQWPQDQQLVLPGLNSQVVSASTLVAKTLLPFKQSNGQLTLDLSAVSPDPHLTVIKLNYAGQLDITPIHTKANQHGVIQLAGDLATKHGKFGKESYRSMLKDFSRSWHLDVPTSGQYQIQISYKMRYPNKDFVLRNNDSELPFTLSGNGGQKQKLRLFDGNEVDRKPTVATGDFRIATVGELYFSEPGVQALYMEQGQPFELKASTVDFFKQDQTYRSMNIEIDAIKLIPMSAVNLTATIK